MCPRGIWFFKQVEEAAAALCMPSRGSAAPAKAGNGKQSRICCLWV